nr:GIY-YIG nuclease [Sicyoidochytrium minutum DNA virus]
MKWQTRNKMPLPDVPGYYVYLLENPFARRTYIGSTTDIERRLRQHNSEISGGARYTTSLSRVGRKWAVRVLVFFPCDGDSRETKKTALRFEWRAKRAAVTMRPISGLDARRVRMIELTGEDLFVGKCHVILDSYYCPRDEYFKDPTVCDGFGFIEHCIQLPISTSQER